VEIRWTAVGECRRSLRDEDVQVAYRETLIDLASGLIRLASELPAPTAQHHFDPTVKAQATKLAAVSLNGNASPTPMKADGSRSLPAEEATNLAGRVRVAVRR
jgi:hypothetical protein